VIGSGAILRIYAKKSAARRSGRDHHRKADITPRQRAMLDFAMQVALTPGSR